MHLGIFACKKLYQVLSQNIYYDYDSDGISWYPFASNINWKPLKLKLCKGISLIYKSLIKYEKKKKVSIRRDIFRSLMLNSCWI